jgi:siroheme synthase
MAGRVVFVGGGTGDPRLVTVRGAEVLAAADVIFAPPGLDVHEHAREGAELVTRAAGTAAAELVARAGVTPRRRATPAPTS